MTLNWPIGIIGSVAPLLAATRYITKIIMIGTSSSGISGTERYTHAQMLLECQLLHKEMAISQWENGNLICGKALFLTDPVNI
jgi:hypothetical protein